jgi:predicted acylesterase/phospholipase RssA
MKKNPNDKDPIPISSIIGSSAGGMIALAISTGIDPHLVENICYKMSTIP